MRGGGVVRRAALALPRRAGAARCYLPSAVMPIWRAVPAMIFSAAARSLAFRSGIFVSAIDRTCSRVRFATLVLCGSPEPFSMPAAARISRAAGGLFVVEVDERGPYTHV